jgi:hypothetical protein
VALSDLTILDPLILATVVLLVLCLGCPAAITLPAITPPAAVTITGVVAWRQ